MKAAKTKLTKLKLILDNMSGLKSYYFIAVLSLALGALFQFVAPLVIRLTIDAIIGEENIRLPLGLESVISISDKIPLLLQNLWIAGLTLFILTLLTNLFTYLRGYLGAYCSEELVRRLREQLYNHMQHLPFCWYSKVQTGDIVQRCTSDLDTIRRFFGQQLIQVGRSAMIVAIVLPIMLYLNKTMALISMIVVPVIFGYSYFFYRRVRNQFKEADEEEGNLTAVLEEAIGGIRVVRAFSRRDYEIERFNASADRYRGKCYRLIFTLACYWSTSDFLCFMQIGTVLVVGTHLTVRGDLTLGTLVVFMTYVSSFLWPIREMGRTLTDMGRAFVSLDRVKEILDTVEEESGGDYIIPENHRIQGKIEFRNVSYGYEEGQQVLENINFTINPGEIIAVLGATGSGKSTLVHLIPRLIDNTSGEILIDGREIAQYNKKSLRKQVGLVLQEPFLYSKTVAENICIAASLPAEEQQQVMPYQENRVIPPSTYERIEQAARETALHETIIDFENRYETIVGEKGITLSGGQRQRVAIARMLINNPPVIILDDSLSAVDFHTERLIGDELAKKRGKTTIILITHRFTSANIADRILVMDKGKIIQQGVHRELINQEGPYRRIWNIQQELEQETG